MICSNCPNEARPFNRYCKPCHNEYMRDWRKGRPLTPNQKIQLSAVSRLHVQMNRYKLKPLPCEVCGSAEKLEGHHEDYDFPMVVRWLCHDHHVQVTRGRLVLEPASPRWMMDIVLIHEFAQDLNVSFDEAWRKLTIYLMNKRKQWIAAGRVGWFKSYPIPYQELVQL